MTIQEAVATIIRGEQAFKFPLVNQHGWIADANNNHVLDVRGWGYLQYHGEGREKAAELQDFFGDWVVQVLNDEARRLGLITI